MILGLFCLILAAQDPGAVEGRVSSATSHTPLSGVTVSSKTARVTTDAGGNFRLPNLAPGDYTLTFAADGFFDYRAAVHIDSAATTPRLDVEITPHSSISGQLTDPAGRPLALVPVEITQAVRGTGTMWFEWHGVSDRDGRYRRDGLQPGAYLVMARPQPKVAEVDGVRRTLVSTYSPGVSDRANAARIVLRGGTQATADIRVIDAPVYTLRGLVFDDTGRKAYSTLRLVAAGFMEAQAAEAKSPNGAFEFRDVPAGDWRLIAETDYAGTVLRGSAAVLLDRHDVENISVRLSRPFSVTGSVEPSKLGAGTSLELFPIDDPPVLAAFTRAAADGAFEFPAVYPGRYRVDLFATHPDHYIESIRSGTQDALGKDLVFAEGMPPLRVIYKADAGSITGRVEECRRAPILALPADEALWNFRFIRHATCDASGHFEIAGLRPGSYSVLALDRIDETGLDDLTTLRRLVAAGTRVTIEPARPALVELKRTPWPE